MTDSSPIMISKACGPRCETFRFAWRTIRFVFAGFAPHGAGKLRKRAGKPLESQTRVKLCASVRSGWQGQKTAVARFEAKQEAGAGGVPGESADRTVARVANQNLGRVGETAEEDEAVGIADRDDERLRMKGDAGHARLAHAAFAGRLAHRPVLVLERPDHGGVGAGGRKPRPVVRPGERARLRRITVHAHVARILESPAVQRVLLHRGDQKPAVGREGDVEMRAFPFERPGRPFDLREPERCAVVMGGGEAKTLGLESKAANGRRRAPSPDRPGFVARANLLARAPRAGLAAQRERVDPAALLVGDLLEAAIGLDRDDASVISSGEQNLAVAGRGQYRGV